MRDAKIQEVSKQLLDINHKTRAFLRQQQDEKASLENALTIAKELDKKVFANFGADEVKYKAEMDRLVNFKRRALDEAMKTPIPNIIQIMKDSLPKFVQWQASYKDQEPPKVLGQIIDFIQQINSNTPHEAIQKLFLIYIAPMKIKAADQMHSSISSMQSSPNIKPNPPDTSSAALTPEQTFELNKILNEIQQCLTDFNYLNDKDPRPELQDMRNFIQSIKIRDITQKDFPLIQKYYTCNFLPISTGMQYTVAFPKLIESLNELKQIAEYDNQSVPTYVKKYIKAIESIPAPTSTNTQKQAEMLQIYIKLYPQVIEYIKNAKVPHRNTKSTVPSTPLQECPSIPRAPSTSQMKQIPPASPIQINQPKEPLTDSDRIEIVKKIFSDLRAKTSYFRINPYPIF